MGTEYELKFQANPDCQESILTTFPGNWQRISMETTYYDTPSGSLSARRYTLRRRLENGISICTLKTPGKGKLRGEWEVNCDRIQAAIPELCKLGAPRELETLCGEGLIPICGARFVRKAATLTFLECTLELALDDGALFGRGKELPLCEVEIELKDGTTAAADNFARQLAEIYDLQAEEKSKFARALALYKEEV